MLNTFAFENFEPNHGLSEHANRKLSEVLDRAPSDSFPVARVVAKRGGFEATLELFSQAGYFVARATDKFPRFAIDEACRQLLDRLKIWRSTRDLNMPDPLNSPSGLDKGIPDGTSKVS